MPKPIRGHDYPALQLIPTAFEEFKPTRSIKPTGNLLHVKPDHDIRHSGLIQQTGNVDRRKLEAALAQCLVLAVGPEVQDIKAGDVVLIEQHAYSGKDRFDIFKDGTAVYPCEAAVCVVERT